MTLILTGRYSTDTWNDCVQYRRRRNMACIYAPSTKITNTIRSHIPLFIIEMNNTTNQILGIGLIYNKPVTDRVYRVYADTNYNQYIYIGKHHISREVLDNYNPLLVYILEQILFKGYTHSKRGIGLTKMPKKVMSLPVCEGMNILKEIKHIFIHHYKSTPSLTAASSS